MRDELVRAVMPQVRVLLEQLVKTAVDRSLAPLLERQHELEATIERSIAPLLDKQRKLEATIEELRRTQIHPQHLPGVVARHTPEPTPSTGNAHAEERPLVTPSSPILPAENVAHRPIAIERPAARPRTDTIATAYDANVLADLPAELNGSRRRRAVMWILAIAVLVVLLSVTGLSLLSHTGRYL